MERSAHAGLRSPLAASAPGRGQNSGLGIGRAGGGWTWLQLSQTAQAGEAVGEERAALNLQNIAVGRQSVSSPWGALDGRAHHM